MPRPSALASVSVTALQAEIQRRVGKLSDLLKFRDQVDKEIAELQALAGRFGKAAPAQPKAGPAVRRGRKVKPAARKKAARGVFKETGKAMILRLLAEKPRTSAELVAEWKEAGRGGTVANELTRLVKSGAVNRAAGKAGMGSIYSAAGGKPAAKAAARPAARPAARKPSKRKAFAVTAEQFILDLLQGRTLTTRQVNAAWKQAGRGGVADSDLSNLVKAEKIKRDKLGGKLGSNYSVA